MLRMRTLPWVLALGLTACFMGNNSPQKKISDTVFSLNDNARWGRISDAALMVEPSYRDTFVNAHQSWGTDIKLADTEIVQVQIAPDAERASAIVTYSWYAMDTMTLHETTVRQHWSALGSGYALTSEAVVRGDPRLLGATASAAGATAAAPSIE